MRCLASLVLVVVLLLAGCVGTRNAVPAAPLEDAQAIPGSLGGIIVDDEQRPVAQARLLLLEAGLETESDAGGRFVFLNVPPGQAQPSEANVYARKRGPSPLRVEWQHPRSDWLPWVMARARITGTSEQYVGLALNQRFEMFNTVFYGGAVPDGWSVTKPPSG